MNPDTPPPMHIPWKSLNKRQKAECLVHLIIAAVLCLFLLCLIAVVISLTVKVVAWAL